MTHDEIATLHRDVLARIRAHSTPRWNTPTQADLLDIIAHVNAAFRAAQDALRDAGALAREDGGGNATT